MACCRLCNCGICRRAADLFLALLACLSPSRADNLKPKNIRVLNLAFAFNNSTKASGEFFILSENLGLCPVSGVHVHHLTGQGSDGIQVYENGVYQAE